MIEVTPKQTTVAVTVDGHDGTVVTVQPTRQPVIVTPVFTVATGPAGGDGPEGPAGPSAAPSADDGNQLTNGSDGGLYMGPPQLETAQW